MEQRSYSFDTLAAAKSDGFMTIAETKALVPDGFSVTDTSGTGYFGYDYSIQKGEVVVLDSYSVSTGMGSGWKNIKITPMFKLSEIVSLVA